MATNPGDKKKKKCPGNVQIYRFFFLPKSTVVWFPQACCMPYRTAVAFVEPRWMRLGGRVAYARRGARRRKKPVDLADLLRTLAARLVLGNATTSTVPCWLRVERVQKRSVRRRRYSSRLVCVFLL